MEKIIVTRYDSPCGGLVIGETGGRLCMCDWISRPDAATVRARLARLLGSCFENGMSETIERAVSFLDGYFAGRDTGCDIPLLFAGTDFQKKVWHELSGIPYGDTVSYSDIARKIGMPRAVRAVAGAIGANAISIIVPCHRVIGRDGSLTGYAGGVAAKRYLLDLERKHKSV